MSNPTSNFGWQMPTNSDLVTDLPADFEVFGQAVDTSLADLKGGTTGQILSKASGTDMDFTWINNDQGDITGVTAGTGLTGGGTSGDVTVSFDVANYGGGEYAAGKNKIINGDFGIWQRGTSISYTGSAAVAYSADRWYHYTNGNGSWTFSRQTFTSGTAPVAGYEGIYFARASLPTAGTTTAINWGQRIEDVQTFAGQTVTISFWAKADSARSFNFAFEQNFGSGGSSTVTTNGSNISVTTSWARYSTTITVPSISGKTIGTSSYLSVYINNGAVSNGFILDIWGVQLEAGSTATPFQTATGTKQGELAACQRYYWRETASTTYSNFGTGYWDVGNGKSQFNIPMPVTMRIAPSSVEYSTLMAWDGSAVVAITALTIGNTTKSLLQVTATQATGGTAYRFMVIGANNSTSAYIAASAEL